MHQNNQSIVAASKIRAEALFNAKAREERKADLPKAMQDYREAEEATRSLTRKLRDERLARQKA